MDNEQKPTIIELADWFLAREAMTHKKLQKLCYYAVAWGYTLMGKQIFENDEFQAWVHGPVSPVLYEKYKFAGWNNIQKKDVSPKFQGDVEELLESVWDTYGSKDGNELEALSHSEKPWRSARIGLKAEDRGMVAITPEAMKDYYRTVYVGDYAVN